MIRSAIRGLTYFTARATFANGRLRAVVGPEQIPRDGDFMIVSNHRSGVDSFLIGFVVRRLAGRRICVPTKKRHFERPVLGYWLRVMGAEPIALDEPASAYADMRQWVSEGRTLLMFPEGTRGQRPLLQPFRYGAFNIAVSAGLPILPVAVHGTEGLWPTGHWYFLRSGAASVAFGRVVSPNSDADWLRAEVRRRIQSLYDGLAAGLQSSAAPVPPIS